MKLSLSSVLGVVALAAVAACTGGTNGTNDPNANDPAAPKPGAPGANTEDPPPNNGKPPGAPCGAAPAAGVEKPIELTGDIDLHPQGAFVDSQHRAIVYGWSNPALFADSTSLFVARFTADGAVDTTFGKGGLASFDSLDDTNGVPQGVAATVDGSDRVVLTWLRWNRPNGGSNGERVLSAARLDAKGALDRGFAQGGFVESFPLGLGAIAANPNNPGELASASIEQNVNTAVAAIGSDVFAYTTVHLTKTVFGGNTIDVTDVVRGVRVGGGGAIDAGYKFEKKRASFGIIGAAGIGNFVYLWIDGLGAKLDAMGNADPSFALDAPVGPATVAVRNDGTLLGTDYKTIYTLGPDGKRQDKLTDHGGRFTVRCDGRLAVATTSSNDIEASLLLPNGEIDTSRGTAGVVRYTKPADLTSSNVVTAFDPASGTITQFYVRVARSAADTLVAVRLHP